MSSSTSILHINSEQSHWSALKAKIYTILQKNHVILWQHFIISILNHIQYKNCQSKHEGEKLQCWIKRQIQQILKWMSDPKNKQFSLKYKAEQRHWKRQKIEWENAFERLLENERKIKDEYEIGLQQMEENMQNLQRISSELRAKNSVLEKTMQLYKIKLQKEQNLNIKKLPDEGQAGTRRKKCISSNLKIISDFNIKISSMHDVGLKQAIQKQSEDYSTMTTVPLKAFQQIQYVVDVQNSGTIKKEKQTQTENKIEMLRYFSKSQHMYMKIMGDNNQQMNQSISSQSSYLLECDTGTQTEAKGYKHKDTQTQKEKKEQKQNEQLMAMLLLKISELQQRAENASEEIRKKEISIKQMENKIYSNKRQLSELKQQVKVSQHLEQHISQKYEKINQQYAQLQQNYKQLLSNFTNYIDTTSMRPCSNNMEEGIQTDTLSQSNYGKESNLTTLGLSEISKCEQLDDQIFTIESDEQDMQVHFIQKSTVERYLVEWMNMQIQSGSAEKKLTVFMTLLQTVGMCEQNAALVKQYSSKICSQYQFAKNNKEKQDMQQKLYKYLTNEQ